MKTYSELKSHPAFNWKTAIENAIKEGVDFELKLWLDTQASQWVTCAVGNQCDIIPRMNCGAPNDHTLRDLGNQFYLEISQGRFNHALLTLDSIEQRSAILIERLTKHK